MASERSTPAAVRHVAGFLATWLPVLVCCFVIFNESKQGMGSAYTSRFLRPLWTRWFGPISDANWYELHHAIRKCGHFVGYGATGLSWQWGWWRQWRGYFRDRMKRWRWSAAMALFCTAVFAATDELHQTYLPGRSGQMSDVGVDVMGAVVLMGAAFLLRWKRLTS